MHGKLITKVNKLLRKLTNNNKTNTDKMNKQTSFIVQKTDEYDIFNTLHSNRAIDPVNVKRLEESMEANGVLINPILVNARWEVIDGQHRLQACKNLNKHIYYLIVGDYGIGEVQALNLNQKNWGQADYAKSFASMGYEHYQNLLDFQAKYDEFSLGSCIKLLQNSTSSKTIQRKRLEGDRNISGESRQKQVFEEGTWEIDDYDLAVEWATYLRRLEKYYDGYNRAGFVATMIGLFRKEQFDKDEFLRKLNYQSNSLGDCSNVGDYLMLIEDIYNYKKRDKVSLRY